MSNSHHDPPACLPFQDRIRRVVTVLLSNERTKAAEVGLPGPVFADVALDTLLALAADLACSLIVPAEKADVRERQTCAARVHRGLAQACTAILAQEHSATEPHGLRNRLGR